MILLRLFFALLLAIVSSRLAVVLYMFVTRRLWCATDHVGVVRFDCQAFFYLLGFLLLSAMMFVDCVPVGTSVDDTSVAPGRVRTLRSQ